MIISNIRFGFANNSSSSHSMVFLDPVPPDFFFHYPNDFFGNFTASSEQSKMAYIGGCLYISIRDALSVSNSMGASAVANKLANMLVGTNFNYDYYTDNPIYIDHQSLLAFPLTKGTRSINLEFFNDLVEWVKKPNLVILGGSDESNSVHPLMPRPDPSNPYYKIPKEVGDGIYGRKDGDWWTIFYPEDGSKIRLSFKDNPAPYTKSTYPELVDLKITDFCPFDCDFCYQGSTLAGKHADRDFISSVISNLGEMNVFEVAIGGGEPTMHPEFLSIVMDLNRKGICANFTTKNLAWLRDTKFRDSVFKNCSSFAYSVTNSADVVKISSLMEEYVDESDPDRIRFSVQYVLGTASSYAMADIFEECYRRRVSLTLLGFKETHRGIDFKPNLEDNSKWMELIKDMRAREKYFNVSVDTCVVQQYEEQLKDIDKVFYHKREGTFSCYIDAVEKTIAPSSYSGTPLSLGTAEEISVKYATFENTISLPLAEIC